VSEFFVPFPGLKSYGVRGTRPHINKLIDRGLVPPPVSLSPNRIAWRLPDLELFKNSRPAAGEPLPQLWPLRDRKGKPAGKSPGRPVGSRIVVDADGKRRLVLPVEAADAG
jgi:hypothetical protein